MTIENAQAFEQELITNGTAPYTWTPPHETEASTWILDPVKWDWQYLSDDLAAISFTIKRWYS